MTIGFVVDVIGNNLLYTLLLVSYYISMLLMTALTANAGITKRC